MGTSRARRTGRGLFRRASGMGIPSRGSALRGVSIELREPMTKMKASDRRAVDISYYQSARGAGLLWVVGPLWYLAAGALSASAFRGYSYATNYISDLGVPDVATFQGRDLNSPLHAVMNAGFIGQALLFLIGLAMLVPRLPRTWGASAFVTFGVLHAAGFVPVALVSGSEANAVTGLGIWHGVGAVAAIACGNLMAIVSGWGMPTSRRLRWAGALLGALGFLSGVLLLSHFILPDGIWERGAVYTFMLWELVAGSALLAGKHSQIGSGSHVNTAPDKSSTARS